VCQEDIEECVLPNQDKTHVDLAYGGKLSIGVASETEAPSEESLAQLSIGVAQGL
jgi:hypothetical protein